MHCSENFPSYDLMKTQENDVKACMNTCSTIRDLCYGVSFNIPKGECYLKGKNITSSRPYTDKDTLSALARASQLRPLDNTCPYPNSTVHTTRSRMDFEIKCEVGMPAYGDYCPDNANSDTCNYHADSLDECMELCSTSHPLCVAVGFHPAMVDGFHNCYPKNAVNASGFTDASNPVVHFAVAKTNNITTPCVDSSIRTSSNNKHFQLSCNKNRDGDVLAVYHDESLDACIDTCATYTNGTCLGVVFDSDMINGFENCYLKKEIGVPNSVPNMTFAIHTAGNGTSSFSEDVHSSSSSKAWIAGPIIGAIVLLSLIAGLVFWRRRRRRSKRASTAQPYELGNVGYEALEMNEGKGKGASTLR